MRIPWQGKVGRRYRVHHSDQVDAPAFTTLAVDLPGIEPQTTLDDPTGTVAAFYWVEMEQWRYPVLCRPGDEVAVYIIPVTVGVHRLWRQTQATVMCCDLLDPQEPPARNRS